MNNKIIDTLEKTILKYKTPAFLCLDTFDKIIINLNMSRFQIFSSRKK
jgi:hypothetical protein